MGTGLPLARPNQHATFLTTTGNTGFDEALIVGWRQ